MAGVKRSRDGPKVASADKINSSFVSMFEGFKAELDEHHERRERIIKTSRDITAQSKKIIFALQRVRELGQPIHISVTKQMLPMQSIITELFQTVAPDLHDINAYRYQRQISGGVQEYMEAILFQHYLETQHVLSHEEAVQGFPAGLDLTYEDYALGLFDMTGELMRFAITYMATNGKLPGSSESGISSGSIMTDMQEIRSQLEIMDVSGSFTLSKEFDQKLKTTKSSVEKIENSVYSMIVRGSERPQGWRPDVSTMDGPSEQIESY